MEERPDVALLGDAHLFESDPEVDRFVAFLDRLPPAIGTVAILGDLFAAWIGRRELLRTHQGKVLDGLRALRRRGIRLIYVEGNHDFFLSPLFDGDPFDSIASGARELDLAGRRVHLAHGDLMNRRDRQYRAWRAVSKNRVFFALFNLLPAGRRLGIVDGLERRLAATNMAFRGGFPVGECEAYARPVIGRGIATIVLGHFHEELRFEWEEAGRRGRVFVLPAWREGHRYLRLSPGADPVFVSS